MLMTVTGKELDKEKTKVCDATVCKVSGTMTSQIMSSPFTAILWQILLSADCILH